MKNKTQLWDAVSQTDVRATKENTQGGRRSTSINGYFMLEAATEQWGPQGTDWWFEIVEERFDEGAPIINGEGNILCHEKTHTIVVHLYYPDSQKPVIGVGHTPYLYKSKNGITCDKEYYKKSLTDAKKKALADLGFSADVYQGEFDDANYVAAITAEQQIESAASRDEEIKAKNDELIEYVSKHKSLIESAVTNYEANGIYKVCAAHLTRQASVPDLAGTANQGLKALGLAISKFKDKGK